MQQKNITEGQSPKTLRLLHRVKCITYKDRVNVVKRKCILKSSNIQVLCKKKKNLILKVILSEMNPKNNV